MELESPHLANQAGQDNENPNEGHPDAYAVFGESDNLYKTSESSSIHNAVSENKLGQMNIDSTVTEENQEDFFITFSTKEEAIKKVERATFIENENLTENLPSTS
jgi:hypothetical protein